MKCHVDGYVYEHRKIIYDMHGTELPPCKICGKRISWTTCHVDHIDTNVRNNAVENLRAVCRGCNTSRTKRSTIHRYEYQGSLMTLTELAKVDGVQVCRHALNLRLKKGMPLLNAMFDRNVTHPKPITQERR